MVGQLDYRCSLSKINLLPDMYSVYLFDLFVREIRILPFRQIDPGDQRDRLIQVHLFDQACLIELVHFHQVDLLFHLGLSCLDFQADQPSQADRENLSLLLDQFDLRGLGVQVCLVFHFLPGK